ncbi:MAG: hypothetical protein PWP54_1039 [Thermosipho sp. (in: thermotogales)]|nr:hypothetical protein [Thermosipho sp. (in: thermotogales)]MDN5325142.1 hypothetical protein [Thermosipho sp. (in: thermotogales)]
MSDFEKLKELLEKISVKYNCKIWIAQKIGKRISFINKLKAGKEYFLPPKILWENENFVIFSENLNSLDAELQQLLNEVIDIVRNIK